MEKTMAKKKKKAFRDRWDMPRDEYNLTEKFVLWDVEPLMDPIHVSSLKGQTVGVDAISFLNTAALVSGACRSLALGIPTKGHIKCFIEMVDLLKDNGVTPIIVFHGRTLDMLKWIEEERASRRIDYLKRALANDTANYHEGAIKYYLKAFDISSVAYKLFKELKVADVEFIVAPYDANAQLAFLHKNNLVRAVITDDPCLIPFGFSRIIFKMDRDGYGYDLQVSKLLELSPREHHLYFAGFTNEMLLHACILGRCSYLPFRALSVFRSSKLFDTLGSYAKVKNYLSDTIKLDGHSLESIEKAYWAYRYQRVYDPVKKEMTHLSNLPDEIPTYFDKDLNFLGPSLPKEVVTNIAGGKLNPVTMKPYEDEEDEENDTKKRTKPDDKEIFKRKKEEYFSGQEAEDIFLSWDLHGSSSESSCESD